MLKSTIALAVGAMLAPGLSAAPTIQKFIIDPNPTREHTGITGLFNSITRFFRDNEDSSLEKVVGYFTSITNPSVVNANGNGSGGVFLYVNNGSLSGTWTRHRIGDGDCYEHAASFKYPGDKYPGIIASCDNRLVWFENPANSGGNPFSKWPSNVIYGNSGCHDFRLADVDEDGKPDVVCSSAVSLGNMQNFILYQNDRNSWSYVAGPGQIGDHVALISVDGSPRNNVVGSAIDGSGVYWFKYPGSRNGLWTSHYIGSANAGVSIGSGTLPNRQDYVVIASNEDQPVAWPGGLAFFAQNSDPTQPWNATTIDSSYRAVHQLSVGTFDGGPYILAAEQEQACIASISDSYHANIPCRMEIFKYQGGTFEPLVLLTRQGTHNQSVIPYNGGLLVVGANHGVFGGYPALQGWIVGPSEPPPDSGG
jgi:FG-GAP-like repeat